MKLSLDQTTDPSYQELYRYLKHADVPDFVKEAELADSEALAKLGEEAFADRYHRAYPINDSVNTYVSNAYFINKRAQLEEKWGKNYVNEIEARIQKAASIFGITDKLEDFARSTEKIASRGPEERVVYTAVLPEGNFDLFPYKTAADLTKQASLFTKHLSDYPFAWRHDISTSFVKAASELQVDELPDIVLKYAGMIYPDISMFHNELQRRFNKIAARVDVKKYEEVVKQAEAAGSVDDYLVVCGNMYELEKSAGAYDYQSLRQTLGDIVDRTFTLSVEKVADLLNVVDMGGETFHVPQLQKVSKDIYKEAFGVDIDPSDSNQLRDVLPTMPLSDVALFKELSGIGGL